MCDYSLHAAKTSDAEVGNRLVVSQFYATVTRGFANADKPRDASNVTNEAVCCRPGTEIAFDAPVRYRKAENIGMTWVQDIITSEFQVARFVKINEEAQYQHHDALEFPDGSQVLIHDLELDQTATVLQLPFVGTISEAEAHDHVVYDSNFVAPTEPYERELEPLGRPR